MQTLSRSCGLTLPLPSDELSRPLSQGAAPGSVGGVAAGQHASSRHGADLLPYLQTGATPPHEILFFYKGRHLVGVRRGKWKYLRRHLTDNGGYTSLSQGPFLFNLELDPHEAYSLIESEPEVATELSGLLDAMDARVEANLRGWQ